MKLELIHHHHHHHSLSPLSLSPRFRQQRRQQFPYDWIDTANTLYSFDNNFHYVRTQVENHTKEMHNPVITPDEQYAYPDSELTFRKGSGVTPHM